MVYVLCAKYALPETVPACPVVEAEGFEDSQFALEQKDPDAKIEIDSALKKVIYDVLETYYVTPTIEGKEINKMMVYSEAAVNVITVRTMTILDIKRTAIQQTALTVKNFAGTITKTLGLLFLKVKLGPADVVHTFFVVDCTAPYSGILERDWIHISYCARSSMHHELLIWNPVIDEAELLKADPRPFSVSANSINAS